MNNYYTMDILDAPHNEIGDAVISKMASLSFGATTTQPSQTRRTDSPVGNGSFETNYCYLDSFAVSSNMERKLSPVHEVFESINWSDVNGLKLTSLEIAILTKFTTKPLETILSDLRDSFFYVRVILKVVSYCASRKRYCYYLASLDQGEIVSVSEALELFRKDSYGVALHYCASMLRDIMFVITDSDREDIVPIGKLFYVGKDRSLSEQISPILDVIENGAKDDLFLIRELSLFVSQVLLVGLNSTTHQNIFLNTELDTYEIVGPSTRLINWMSSCLEKCTSLSYNLVLPSLNVLMISNSFRYMFLLGDGIAWINKYLAYVWSEFKKVNKRSDLVVNAIEVASTQKLYEVLFLVWSLSFIMIHSSTCKESFTRSDIVLVLVDLLKVRPREKLVRLALSTLRNLLCTQSEGTSNLDAEMNSENELTEKELISLGLVKEVKNLKTCGYTDPDIIDDLEFLENRLLEICNDMTSWDYYKNELESNKLKWGSLHTPKFLQENVRCFEGRNLDFKVLKRLLVHIHSNDHETCAVACFDIGEFVRNYPNGKSIITNFGVKDQLLDLIDHPSLEVQREALRCLSRILLRNDSVMEMNGNSG